MKKIILIIIIVFLSSSCFNRNSYEQGVLNEHYNQNVPDTLNAWSKIYNNRLLMSVNEINKYNEGFFNNDFLRDLNDYHYSHQKGIIINRALILNALPEYELEDEEDIPNLDEIIIPDELKEIYLKIGTPVLIIEEVDDVWFRVISENFEGWTARSNVAVTTMNDWNRYTNIEDFIIITEPIIGFEDKIIDMGTKLPLTSIRDDHYRALIYCLGTRNNLVMKDIVIPNDKAHIGYLPYTNRNIVIQALKYDDITYTDGMTNNLLISNIFSTFGFILPLEPYKLLEAIEKNFPSNRIYQEARIKSIEDSKHPSVLYRSDDVMFHFGKRNNKHFVLRLNELSRKISYEELLSTDNIFNITYIGHLN